MNDIEKITIVQTLVENDSAATDALCAVYLSEAKSDILRRLYRAFGEVPEDAAMPPMYDFLQCKLASRRFLKRGGQGEMSHNENGVNRSYYSADDEDLLKEVMPYARVF